MPRAAARFTQADVARIIRGAAQSGVPVVVDFLPDGTIRGFVNSGVSPQEIADDGKKDLPEEREPDL